MPEHFGWWLLTMACVVWYSTITVFVAIKGIADIRNMLRRLSRHQMDKPAKIDSDERSQ